MPSTVSARQRQLFFDLEVFNHIHRGIQGKQRQLVGMRRVVMFSTDRVFLAGAAAGWVKAI